MRTTANLMIGLARDPLLLFASVILALGLAMIAVLSLVMARRMYWRLDAAIFEPKPEPAL